MTPEKILQIMPADGWRALYAKRIESGELELWTEPLIGWALVEEIFPDEDGRPTKDIERSVQGLVSYGVQGATLAPGTAGFVLTYVQAQQDLEPHRSMAEALISSWEKLEHDEDAYFQEDGGDPTP
jgi:hypothetical protein